MLRLSFGVKHSVTSERCNRTSLTSPDNEDGRFDNLEKKKKKNLKMEWSFTYMAHPWGSSWGNRSPAARGLLSSMWVCVRAERDSRLSSAWNERPTPQTCRWWTQTWRTASIGVNAIGVDEDHHEHFVLMVLVRLFGQGSSDAFQAPGNLLLNLILPPRKGIRVLLS